jgi:hypothetical protein
MQHKESGNEAIDRYETQENAIKSNTSFDTTIYRMSAEEIRWGVAFPGDEWPIPTIRADFLRINCSEPVLESSEVRNLIHCDIRVPSIQAIFLTFHRS